MVSDVADCITVVAAGRDAVWDALSRAELIPRMFSKIGAWDRISEQVDDSPGLFAVQVGDQACGIVHHRIRVVEARHRAELLIEGVDISSFASIRLADTESGDTKVVVTVFKPAAVHERIGRLDNSAIVGWVIDGLCRIEDYLIGAPTSVLVNTGDYRSLQLSIAKTMISVGVVRAARPDRGIRQLSSLARWGFTLAGGFAAAAAREPRQIAVTDDRGSCTFAQLHSRSNQLAAALNQLGITESGTVGILSRNHTPMVEAIVACGKLGADVVLFNTGLGPRQIEDIARRRDLEALLLDEEFERLVEHLPNAIPRFLLRSHGADRPSVDELIDGASERFPRPEHPGQLVVLTSGTTGSPKRARRPTPRGFGTVAAMLSRMPLRMHERMLIAAPLFHSWGLAALQISTPLRAEVLLQDRFDPEHCLRAIARHRATSLVAVPIMLQRIIDLPERVRRQYDTSSLRVVACSGSALSAALVTDFMDAFGDVLYNFYGSTEVSWGTIADPEDLRSSPTTAGRPPLGTGVAILDEDAQVLPRGAVGRIFVGNDMIFDGYLDAATPRQVDDPQAGAMMDTGDLGYLDTAGRLFVSGRDDEMIISGGENVFPRPVEEALSHLPQIGEVAVVGVPDLEYGQRLVAFVVPRDGVGIDAEMVRGYIRHRLNRFSVPREVIFVKSLPRNATGKILKRRLIESRPG